ncbi:MAG: ATP-binding protein [Flavobacteriales bacterium]|nr:ATP-binding protein [Flavobacteriales bacterium]
MKKIVLIGPESTGKTTMALKLSARYGGCYVPEYSRSYVIEENRELTLDDVMPIVEGQLAAESKSNAEIQILDSNPLASAVYSQWYYGSVPSELDKILSELHYDLYLLCYPDIDWEEDAARCMSSQQDREDIYDIFLKRVQQSGVPYAEIKGEGSDRYSKAIDMVEKILD